jgi:hypothetical protein
MVALLGNLLFHQLHRVGVWIALDVQLIPYHLDHDMPILMNEVGRIQHPFLSGGLQGFDPMTLTARRERRLLDVEAVGMRHSRTSILL